MMLLRRNSVVYALLLGFIRLVVWPSVTAGQEKPRDLTRYDTAGPFTIGVKLNVATRAAMNAEIRAFIWNHWYQRRLGQLTAIYYSREGDRSDVSYFVEPNEGGVWHLAVTIDRTLRNRRGPGQHRESVAYEARDVDRIEIPKTGLAERVEIPEKAKRRPQSYHLVLKDETGKTLTEL